MGTFAAQILAWTEKTKGDADQVVRYALLTIDGRLVNRSPVGDAKFWKHPAPKGYVGGRFRGNWQVSIGSPAAGTLDVTDMDGSATLAAAAAIISDAKAGEVQYIMNNLPYAKRIEEGWSGQAPLGVVALTVVEWNNIVDAAVNAVKDAAVVPNSDDGDMAAGFQAYPL